MDKNIIGSAVANVADAASAAVAFGSSSKEDSSVHGRYRVECHDAFGNLKWVEYIDNLVTTVGRNDMLDKHLAGSTYTATWYLGLIGATSYTTGPAAADTMASHAGWVEDQNYSQAARPTTAWNAAAAGSKSLSSSAQFSINAAVTIKGCFLTSVATKGGTTGILFSAGTFAGGDKILGIGDTLSVSYTAQLT